MKKDPKHKIGVIRGDLGHSRSSAMSLFDRARTTSYSPFIETIQTTRLSCTIFETWRVICQKSQNFPISNAFGAPIWGSLYRNFTAIFDSRKLDSLRYHEVLFAWSYVQPFWQIWQTDRRTQSHSIYRTSLASRGKEFTQEDQTNVFYADNNCTAITDKLHRLHKIQTYRLYYRAPVWLTKAQCKLHCISQYPKSLKRMHRSTRYKRIQQAATLHGVVT